jgi:hypothetical protein
MIVVSRRLCGEASCIALARPSGQRAEEGHGQPHTLPESARVELRVRMYGVTVGVDYWGVVCGAALCGAKVESLL